MKDYCSLLEKSGESALNLIKLGTTKEQEQKNLDRVIEITKKLMDVTPTPIVEAIGEMSAEKIYDTEKGFTHESDKSSKYGYRFLAFSESILEKITGKKWSIHKSDKPSKHDNSFLALDLSSLSFNTPTYIMCTGLYDYGLDKVIPDKEFNIGSEYCANCPFYEEKD